VLRDAAFRWWEVGVVGDALSIDGLPFHAFLSQFIGEGDGSLVGPPSQRRQPAAYQMHDAFLEPFGITVDLCRILLFQARRETPRVTFDV